MRILFALLLMFPLMGVAAETIKVGVTESVPFAIKENIDGQERWTGITIDLWEEIARDVGIEYEYVDLALQDNLTGVAKGKIDIALGAMSITAEREKIMDFTHPYYMSGLGIVTRTNQATTWSLYGWGLAKAIGMLFLIILVFGVIMRAIEKRNNPQFEKFGDGMWFTIVTMTTTGYGDKVPLSVVGRMFAAFMMISSAILFPTMVASIVANIAVEQRLNQIKGPHDLANNRIGVITGTSAVHYMKTYNIPHFEVSSAKELLSMIDDKKLDGGVYDKPMLQYHAKPYPDLSVLPATFEHQYYGFALKTDSNLRETINAEILTKSNNNMWLGTINKYLGE
ncbi:MAG: transporter substrate-binding domain-containing protein [Neptunomonas phycophila]|uniref:transporter substrate-binding domain-containing protein n=1 Tax=Neptunomonas phycophila TaxID=1572645 RepID=UPI003B8BAC03